MVQSKNKKIGDVNYIFCDDAYLLEINQQYLQHDTYTDIITFDYCEGDVLNGDIFISVERVRENAQQYKVTFQEELVRVMAHGILHLCGYKDKKKAEAEEMRSRKNGLLNCTKKWQLTIVKNRFIDN